MRKYKLISYIKQYYRRVERYILLKKKFVPKKAIKYSMENFLKYGYIHDGLASFFSLDKVIKNIQILGSYYKNEKIICEPYKLTIPKNNGMRRNIYIPNIIAYMNLSEFICNNFTIIESCYLINNENSLFSILKLNPEETYPSFRDNLRKKYRTSIGYKYSLSLDIQKFYESIYTHTITWAILEKKCGKIQNCKKCPDVMNCNEQNRKEFSDLLDKKNQNMNFNETNGILTGPFSSRIFSELILVKIDEKIRGNQIKKDIDFEFTRYVDDYTIFFNDINLMEQIISIFREELLEYKLYLNEEKIELKQYPHIQTKSIEGLSLEVLKDKGVIKYLEIADDLNVNGLKGSYKYALKVISNNIELIKLKKNEKIIFISKLFNMLIVFPHLGRYISTILFHIKDDVLRTSSNLLKERLNKQLNKSIYDIHDEEALWLLTIMNNLRITIKKETVECILKSNNDLLIIILLYILKKENKLTEYSEKIESLYEKLKYKKFCEKHWLLKYEFSFLFPVDEEYYKIDQENQNFKDFFKKIKKLNISFINWDILT